MSGSTQGRRWSKPQGNIIEHHEKTPDLETRIIFEHFYLRHTKRDIAADLGVNMKVVNRTIKEFKKCLKMRRRANMKHLGKKRILQQQHLDRILDLVEQSRDHPVTLAEIRRSLGSQYPELRKVARSTIRRYLKNELRMSYKKLNEVSPKVNSSEGLLKIAK